LRVREEETVEVVEEFPFNGYCHDTGCMKPDSWKNYALMNTPHRGAQDIMAAEY
jgi:hypothetical protein